MDFTSIQNILLILAIWSGVNTPDSVTAQLPASRLFSFELAVDSDSTIISKPKYLSYFNESGYNNQPYFLNDEDLVVTSNARDPLQTDLFLCQLRTRKLTNLTVSSWSEYSGKLCPEGRYIYHVCVNELSEQNLCRISLSGKDAPELIMPNIKNVGYFHLVGKDSVILFRVGDPHELWLYSMNGSTALGLSRNIGRCFSKLNSDEIAYVHKVAPGKWTLRSMNIHRQSSSYLADMPDGIEDFVVLKDGRVLCAKGSIMYILDKKGRVLADWEPVFDFGIWDINNISRMAINESQSMIVLVDEVN